ncbi:MAG: PA0069 family radical SAM protein [Gammaproteobacteria bacterium]|nr:PA0069 family radical SAM protein [Gammaproteobacteria bacterium]
MVLYSKKGRGAVSSPLGRFERRPVELDEEAAHEQAQAAPQTVLRATSVRRIISTNDSPDIPFDQSINPYQGCEHGCVYCYARPSHSYLDLSPGLDFETQIFYKPDAATALLAEWENKRYVCKPITLGANTDPYQPAEKSLQITRGLLEQFLEHRHPVNIITKSHLIARDLDLLEELASLDLCSVAISVPTIDDDLKRIMEPRVPSAAARLTAMRRLAGHGVPTSALLAPIIPAINDHEIESILEAVADAGATRAHYIFLRLPHELTDIFSDWLEIHFPERRNRVLSLVCEACGGRSYDSRFGVRQTGRGAYAEMIGSRFRKTSRRLGIEPGEYARSLDCSKFARPGACQLGLDF